MVTLIKDSIIPFLLCKVSAGFPSPADDFIEGHINLNNIMIEHTSATRVLTMPSDDLKHMGIFLGDYLIVDCSIQANTNKLVACVTDGDFVIGEIDITEQKINGQKLADHTQIVGVVTWVVRRL